MIFIRDLYLYIKIKVFRYLSGIVGQLSFNNILQSKVKCLLQILGLEVSAKSDTCHPQTSLKPELVYFESF